MSHSIASVTVHFVFSTRLRQPIISPELSDPLHAYIGGVVRHAGCVPLAVGGAADHVHVLVGLSRSITLARLVYEIKTASSAWARSTTGGDFHWQTGYAAFSVGPRGIPAAVNYVKNQAEHDATKSYQNKILAFYATYNITPDDQPAWD